MSDARRSVPTQLTSMPAEKPDTQLSAEEDRLADQLADQPKHSADKSSKLLAGSDSSVKGDEEEEEAEDRCRAYS